MYFDLSEIGAISLTLDFDDDFYNEYLSDYGLTDSTEVRVKYIKEQGVEFSIEYYDSETYHNMGRYGTMTYDELVENFGEKLADSALYECLDGKEHNFEIQAYQEENINLNNPTEFNAAALKYLRHGDYFKDCRGFILTNGSIVYTDSEHNQCSKIPGVKGTFDFIRLGNIRISNHGMDVCKHPTAEQYSVIYEILRYYEGERFYLDLMNGNIGNCSKQYNNCDAEEVISDIRNYFERGIKPRVYEKITEKQLKKLISESIIRELNIKTP